MKYRRLGKTGLKVSEIAIGTVSLGMDYGINVPGEFKRPSDITAVELLKEAFNQGINFFDTAPGYGESERLVGEALGLEQNCYFATKIGFPSSFNRLRTRQVRDIIEGSIERSLQNLRIDSLDILQIHNATQALLKNDLILETLVRSTEKGNVRFLGASVYSEAEALTAIQTGCLGILQVPFSILDQRMKILVTSTAERAGVGLIARSIFLKGALTEKAVWLPREMQELKNTVENLRQTLGCSWTELPQYALRYALSCNGFSSCLIGVKRETELCSALSAFRTGPLVGETLESADRSSLDDPNLYNPVNWPIQ